jgi:hypothetical protein
MPHFSLKALLRGMTWASLGFGMLALAFNRTVPPTTKESMLLQAFLVAFGGMLVGFGLSFPFRFPPHRYVLSMVGMFAAQSWQSGSAFGLLIYIGLTLLLALVHAIVVLRKSGGPNE